MSGTTESGVVCRGNSFSPEGYEKLPRSIQLSLRKKLNSFNSPALENWSGEKFKEWRRAGPKVTQPDLAKALCVSRSSIAVAETKSKVSKLIYLRMSQLWSVIFDSRPDYVDPDSGLTPIKEFGLAISNIRLLINRFRPLINKGVLDKEFESLVREADEVLKPIVKKTACLTRRESVCESG